MPTLTIENKSMVEFPQYDWKIKTNRFISFFDILGFKEMVLRESHEQIMNNLSNIQGILKMLDKQATGSIQIKTIQFSDSIIQITSDDSPRSAVELLQRANWLLAGCITYRVPVKGAIAYGLFTADQEKSIYFGQPLIDAYLLQDELKYYGSIIHHTAEYEFQQRCPNEFYKMTFKYKSPVGNSYVQHWNLNWVDVTQSLSKPIDLVSLENLLYCSVSGSARKYVDNTFEFVRAVQNKK